MKNYDQPEVIKIIAGNFSYGETVILQIDGKKETKRKVQYGILDGLYIVINGEKIGYKSLEK